MQVAGFEFIETVLKLARQTVIGPVDRLPGRVAGMPGDDVADAPEVRIGAVRIEDVTDIGAGNRRVADDRLREAVRIGDRLQPARLADMVGRIVMRLDVRRSDDVVGESLV